MNNEEYLAGSPDRNREAQRYDSAKHVAELEAKEVAWAV